MANTYPDRTISTNEMFVYSVNPDGPIDANSFSISSDHPTVANAFPFNFIKGLAPGIATFTAQATTFGATIIETFAVVVTAAPATTLGLQFGATVPKT